MSREIHESNQSKKDVAHEGADKLPTRVSQDTAHALTNPESKLPPGGKGDTAGIPKDFAGQKSVDFNSLPNPYSDKSKPGDTTEKPQGPAHTMSDMKPAPQGETKPAFQDANGFKLNKAETAAKPNMKEDPNLGIEPIPDPPAEKAPSKPADAPKAPENAPSPDQDKPHNEQKPLSESLTDMLTHGWTTLMNPYGG